MSVSSAKRYKVPARPCPICGGGDNLPRGHGRRCSGFESTDGEYAHCSREEQAGSLPLEEGGTYAHKLKGDCKCGAVHNPAPYTGETRSARPEIEATYDYTDEGGTLLFQVLRYKGKLFKQRKPNGYGGWEWKLNGVRRVPYNLVGILASSSDKPVVCVEGEKDANRLISLGAVATCNPGGAEAPGLKNWSKGGARDTARTVLAGRDVIIIADADEPGRRLARLVASDLSDVVRSIKLLEPPAPFKDVSDLLDSGGKYADLVSLDRFEEPPYEPPPPPPPGESSPDKPGVTADHTDLRNAEHLIEWHGTVLRYVGTWEKWLAWDSTRWNMDDLGLANECTKGVARRLFSEARIQYDEATKKYEDADKADDKEKKDAAKVLLAKADAAIKHAIKSQGSGRLSAMLDVARSDPKVAVHHNVLDRDGMLLNVQNGTVDLRTGELRSHSQNDLLTKIVSVPYDARACCPTWDAFLLRVMAGNAELVSFLQRAAGYSLTGTVHEHVLFFCHGNGANGKSTFFGTLHALLGEYAMPAPRDLLFRSRNERHPTELASLYGRRFVTCSEIQEGQAFDEALVKDLTGGDPVSARRMREDFWQFFPSHKLWIAGQHKPVVRGDDEGIWRRMRLIPFTVTIPEHERDTHLKEKLLAELPGVLAWAVRGCRSWATEGLAAPAAVRDATAAYRSENDVLGQFFRERLKFAKEAKVARAELRTSYESWCKEIGAEPLGARRLAARLRERASAEGGELRETTMKVSFDSKEYVVNAWNGVRLLTPDERSSESVH